MAVRSLLLLSWTVAVSGGLAAPLSAAQEPTGSPPSPTLAEAPDSLPPEASERDGAPGGASDYRAFQDSLGSQSDIAALGRLREALESDPPTAHTRIRSGFVALRMFRIAGEERDRRRAERAFDAARDLAPTDPWPLYGKALAQVESPPAEIPSPGGILDGLVVAEVFAEAFGRDAVSQAKEALRDALALRPLLPEAASLLVDLALSTNDRAGLLAATSALRARANAGTLDPVGALALARASAALGHDDVALTAARRAVAANPSAATRLAEARALFGLGRDAEGLRAWRSGLERLDPEGAARYFADVAPLLGDDERAARADDPPDVMADWLAGFWGARAALSGVEEPERAGEHYRRLRVALDQYRRHAKRGSPPANALNLRRVGDRRLDERGQIYVRHGPPSEIIRTPFTTQNESWVYDDGDDEFRLFHFIKYNSPFNGEGGNYADYVLIHTLPCSGRYLDDRGDFDVRLRRLSHRCNRTRSAEASLYMRREARTALATDTHRPDFALDLPFHYDVHTFRGPDGQTEIVTAVAVPVDALAGARAGDDPLEPVDTLRLRVAVVDTTLWWAERDDVLLGVPAAVADPRGGFVRGHLSLVSTPGAELLHRVLVSDGGGAGRITGADLTVPWYGSDRLTLSDLLMAEADVSGTYVRGGHALALVPTRDYRGGTFRLYYEVYNLPADVAYDTEITIERDGGGGVIGAIKGLFGGGPPDPIRVRFQDVAQPDADGAVREDRRIEAAVDSGHEYRISVRVVRRDTGEEVVAERTFLVPEE